MKRAKHGGNIYEMADRLGIKKEEIIDFSANINPLGVPDSFKKALMENMEVVEHYPDVEYTSLLGAISGYNQIDSKYITVGNGATEVIFSMIAAIKPKRSLILAPTFLEYERALKKVGSDVAYYYLKEENNFQVQDDFLDQINGVELIILCNPNNPTGQLVDRDRMNNILAVCKEKNIHLMIDEAFIDFVEEWDKETMKNHIYDYERLYIIRALTKFFGIPGLRIGYGITSNTKLLSRIKDQREPWTINSYAVLAGEVVLKDDGYMEQSRLWIHDERQRFYDQLKGIDKIKVYEPTANYIFFKGLNQNENLQEKLLMKRFLIRDCMNYENLGDCFYRIAIKDKETNDQLIKALEEVFYDH